VKKERNERTGKLLKYASRFYNFGASVLKMALYRDLAKEDPLQLASSRFRSGLEDEYFRQLTAERRKPRSGTASRSIAGSRTRTQANEALDTMNQAEAAATKFGVRGLPDAIWLKLEQEREVPLQNRRAISKTSDAPPRLPRRCSCRAPRAARPSRSVKGIADGRHHARAGAGAARSGSRHRPRRAGQEYEIDTGNGSAAS
jgi:phage terminase large subunit GpA-like protein